MALYVLLLHPSVKKDLRRLDQSAAQYIRYTALPALLAAPQAGIALRGKLRDLRKYVVRHQGTSYRIVYQLSTREHHIVVLHIGPRGEFYERLERRLRR